VVWLALLPLASPCCIKRKEANTSSQGGEKMSKYRAEQAARGCLRPHAAESGRKKYLSPAPISPRHRRSRIKENGTVSNLVHTTKRVRNHDRTRYQDVDSCLSLTFNASSVHFLSPRGSTRLERTAVYTPRVYRPRRWFACCGLSCGSRPRRARI